MLSELPQDPAALADVRAQHLSCDPEDWDFVDLDGPVQCETSDVHSGRPFQRTVTFTDQGVNYTEVRRWTAGGEIYAAVSSSTERKVGTVCVRHPGSADPAGADHGRRELVLVHGLVTLPPRTSPPRSPEPSRRAAHG
ncbi:hypothetical protein GCM10023350_14550 [Nocardioides endophyticus]|uniref:Uncharacterized protein n=1 Tax=Nocardioides endophyticus TaxID=1353775 RepID=A0ABP8YL71_9ACTN